MAVKLSGDFFNMIHPMLERRSHFRLVLRAIINSRDRGFVATYMVQDRFDVVWLDTKLCHSCGARAS